MSVALFLQFARIAQGFRTQRSQLLLPKDFQPNKEFHPKIGHEDEEEDDDHGDGDEGDDDVDHPNSFPSMPGSLPRTNVGHGKNHNNYGYRTVVIVTTRTSQNSSVQITRDE